MPLIVPLAVLGTLPHHVSLATGSQAAMPVNALTKHQSVISGTSTSANPQLSQPTPTSDLVPSPAAESFPCKLVHKVNSSQFIEMRELLVDNISLLHQLKAMQGYHTFMY